MKKITIVVNTYIDCNEAEKNSFDHPTVLKTFQKTNTLYKTIKSFEHVNIPEGYHVDILLLANAVNNKTEFDSQIKKQVEQIAEKSKFDTYIVTNTDIENLQNKGNNFIATDGYCDLRNLGFFFCYHNNTDIIVQIDDDELMQANHLTEMVKTFNANPHIKMLSGLYINENGILQDETKDYTTWLKDKAMNDDRRIILASEQPVELMYGMGGNMMIKRDFFSQVCYPQAVPRGEDFALLLSSYIIYCKGNKLANIPAKNNLFKTYAIGNKEMMIIHKQPYSEKSNKLKYIKLNLIRFIMQRALLENNLDLDLYNKVSRYMYQMTMFEDFEKLAKNIYQEVKEKYPELYDEKVVIEDLNDIKKAIVEYSSKDMFKEYCEHQKRFLESLESSIDMSQYLFKN